MNFFCVHFSFYYIFGINSWIFIRRTDTEAPMLWPPDVKEPTLWKRPWCWERLKARGEGGHRGRDGWMASLTQWAWNWANSWKIVKDREAWSAAVSGIWAGHDWTTEQQHKFLELAMFSRMVYLLPFSRLLLFFMGRWHQVTTSDSNMWKCQVFCSCARPGFCPPFNKSEKGKHLIVILHSFLSNFEHLFKCVVHFISSLWLVISVFFFCCWFVRMLCILEIVTFCLECMGHLFKVKVMLRVWKEQIFTVNF